MYSRAVYYATLHDEHWNVRFTREFEKREIRLGKQILRLREIVASELSRKHRRLSRVSGWNAKRRLSRRKTGHLKIKSSPRYLATCRLSLYSLFNRQQLRKRGYQFISLFLRALFYLLKD